MTNTLKYLITDLIYERSPCLGFPLTFLTEKRGAAAAMPPRALPAAHPCVGTHPRRYPRGPNSASHRQASDSFLELLFTDILNPARLYARQAPLTDAGCRGSRALQSGGGFSTLFAGKGYARLRREAWESKAPSQGASRSRAIPAIPNILSVLLCNSYTVQ